MSRAIRHRHVVKFCLKRAAPFDSYRFSRHTGVEPLTRHGTLRIACPHALTYAHVCIHACARWTSTPTDSPDGVSPAQGRQIPHGRGRVTRWNNAGQRRERPSNKGQRNNCQLGKGRRQRPWHDFYVSSNVEYRMTSLYCTKQILLATSGFRTRLSSQKRVNGLYVCFDESRRRVYAVLFPIADYFDLDILKFHIRRLSICMRRTTVISLKKRFFEKSCNFVTNRRNYFLNVRTFFCKLAVDWEILNFRNEFSGRNLHIWTVFF